MGARVTEGTSLAIDHLLGADGAKGVLGLVDDLLALFLGLFPGEKVFG